jgi:Zn-dependent peptidase ImmA (M78 family)
LALANNPPDIDTAIMVVAENLMKGVPHPPTDLEALALRLNVSGFEAEDMPLSGELRRAGKQFRVFYSSYLPAPQRRFTIAHELGHAVIAKTGPNYPRSGDEVERICDKFAAEFLMPMQEFQRRLRDNPTAERLLELTTLFKVPLRSVAIRAAEFDDVSVFTVENQIVVWSYGAVRKGPFHKNNYYLKNALEVVTLNPSGNISFPMSGEIAPVEGRLSWMRIANNKQSLCVLQKIRPLGIKRKLHDSIDELGG